MPAPGWTKNASGAEIVRVLGFTAARRAALGRASVVLQTNWKRLLSQPGRGRHYEAGFTFITTRGAPRRVMRVRGTEENPGRSSAHTASAPGDPPAVDRGLLRAAVTHGEAQDDIWRVGIGGPRGRIGLALEYGVNVTGSKVGQHPGTNFAIEPRPHGRPAGRMSTTQMTKVVLKEMREGLTDAV